MELMPVVEIVQIERQIGTEKSSIRLDGKSLIEVARSHDVVLLKVVGWLAGHVPARVAERDPVVGSRVRAAGGAFGKFMAVTVGHISGEYDNELYIDLQCVRGMSGGPVVDDDERVVTLVRAFQTDGSLYDPSPNGFTIGAPTRYLRDLLVIARNSETQ
jgi:S1-C subfamily serine protease